MLLFWQQALAHCLSKGRGKVAAHSTTSRAIAPSKQQLLPASKWGKSLAKVGSGMLSVSISTGEWLLVP